MSAENLYQRNLNWAYNIQYDLNQVHSPAVVEMINTTADHLLIDAQLVSVGLRIVAAHHEDRGCVHIANVPQRSRSIVEFNLLIANAGSGKSTIINSLINVAKKKRIYDSKSAMPNTKSKSQEKYRHGTIQEFTGAGMVKALNETGNLFVVIDEFDGNRQTGMFLSENKHHYSTSNAGSIMKSLHTGLSDYQKAKASENITVSDPHVCFLGASNGAPILDIIRYKLKNPSVPDPMAIRMVFDSIRSTPKFNAEYAQRTISEHSISWELFLLTSSLLTNQIFIFEHESSASANSIILNYMDSMIAAASEWEGIDQWYSSRFAKTCELVARVAAQLAHIDETMEVLQLFIEEKNITNPNISVSYERYRQLEEYVRHRYPSSENVIIINERQVKAAMYTTELTLLKYFNLFDIDPARSSPLEKVPLVPSETTSSVSNIASTPRRLARRATSTSYSKDEELQLKQSIMTFESIAFTRTMLYKLTKIRSNNQHLDQILNDLVESKLLRKYERGVLSGNTRTDIYIKCLPTSLEQETTNDWTMSVLDQVKVPWSTYIDSCSILCFPSKSARFTDPAMELLETGPYKNVIQRYIKLSRSALTGNSTSLDIDTPSSGNIDHGIQPEHVQSLPINVSLRTDLQSAEPINDDIQQSSIPNSISPSTIDVPSTTASYIDIQPEQTQSWAIDSLLSTDFQSTGTIKNDARQSSTPNSVSLSAIDVPSMTITREDFHSPEVQSTFIDDSSPMDLSIGKTIDAYCWESSDGKSISSLTAHTPSTTITHENIFSQIISSPSINVSSATNLLSSQTVSQELQESLDDSNGANANNQELVTVQHAFQNLPSLLPFLSPRQQQTIVIDELTEFLQVTSSSSRTAPSDMNQTFVISFESSSICQQSNNSFPSTSSVNQRYENPAPMTLSPSPFVLTSIDVNSQLARPRPIDTSVSNDLTKHPRSIREQLTKADEQHNHHESEDDDSTHSFHTDVNYTECFKENEEAVGEKRDLRRSGRLAAKTKRKKLI